MKLDKIPDRTVESGDAVRFICGLRRGNSVEFSWTRNGTLLSNGEFVKIVNDVDSSVLTIRRANVADAGRYTCIGKNALSEARETTLLKVEGNCLRISRDRLRGRDSVRRRLPLKERRFREMRFQAYPAVCSRQKSVSLAHYR